MNFDRHPWAVLLSFIAMTACSDNGALESSPASGGGGTESGGAPVRGGAGGVTGTGGSASSGGGGATPGSGGKAAGNGGAASRGGAAGVGTSGSGGSSGAGGGGKTGSGGAGGSLPSVGGTTNVGGKDDGGVAVGGSKGIGGARSDGGTGGAGGSIPAEDSGIGFNPCPAGTACKVMPLGDSITEGYGSSSATGGPANQGGYRIELFRQSVTGGKNLTLVGNLTNGPTTVANKTFPKKHEGHGGWTISQIAGIADGSLSTNTPNIIILKIGTNDVNGGGSAAAPNGLKNLINQITKDAPSALLVVSSIIPIKDDNTNNRVKTYNATIPNAVNEAAAAGKHVVFVDSYSAFVADSSWKTKYMSDNLHPNDTGYAVLGKLFYDKINAVLPAGQ